MNYDCMNDYHIISYHFFNFIEELYYFSTVWYRWCGTAWHSTGYSTQESLKYPGLWVSPFCLPNLAAVSMFTRNFYLFPRDKPWSTRKTQTGTGVSVHYL